MKRAHSHFKERPASDSSDGGGDALLGRPSKRKANVYDAVAGRVTQAGLVGKIKDPKASKQILRPDEVLFKQANAPMRYEENDYYFAHENLPSGQQLPSGDLLSALHAYTSKLFARTAEPGVEKTWKCMDETALIALGILMEEAAREKLGNTGDLAFTEADDADESEDSLEDDADTEGDASRPRSLSRSVAGAGDVSSDSLSSSEDESSYNTDASD